MNATTSNVSTMRASFLVANCIAKTKKLFTIGEELILPATENICYELLGEIAFEVMVHIPLSASTINRGIDEITELLSYHGSQSRLIDLSMLTTKQQFLFSAVYFLERCA